MNQTYLIGTSGFNYSEWKGPFYPEDWPKTRWFDYYSQCFATLELNATFYRQFKDQTYEKWYQQAPENFCYVLKASRIITHLKKLKNIEDPVATFWRSANLLGNKLGLILLQLPPNLTYDPELLRNALHCFPDPTKIAVEFRHESWLTEDIKALLTELGTSFVAVDSPDAQPTPWVTGHYGYLRLHGRAPKYHYHYAQQELQDLARLAQDMRQQGAQQVFIFFNNDVEANAPNNALTLQRLLADEQ